MRILQEEFNDMSVFRQSLSLYEELHEVGNTGFSEKEENKEATDLLRFIDDILSGEISTAPITQFDCFNILLVLAVFGNKKVRRKSLQIVNNYRNDRNPMYFGNQLAKRIKEAIREI